MPILDAAEKTFIPQFFTRNRVDELGTMIAFSPIDRQ
jgi:hypothetical protein